MTTPLSGPASSSLSPSGAGIGKEPVNKEMFLRLMVAQLRNQNPLSPVDGVDFLTQLSQISSLEQLVEVRRELEEIHKILGAGPPPGQDARPKS